MKDSNLGLMFGVLWRMALGWVPAILFVTLRHGEPVAALAGVTASLALNIAVNTDKDQQRAKQGLPPFTDAVVARLSPKAK